MTAAFESRACREIAAAFDPQGENAWLRAVLEEVDAAVAEREKRGPLTLSVSVAVPDALRACRGLAARLANALVYLDAELAERRASGVPRVLRDLAGRVTEARLAGDEVELRVLPLPGVRPLLEKGDARLVLDACLERGVLRASLLLVAS